MLEETTWDDEADTLEEEGSVVEWNEGEEPELDEEPGADLKRSLSEEEEALLPDDILRARAEARKPDISALRSAVVEGNFILKKGDYVVIERRRAHFVNQAWLDTRVYRILEEPAVNGDLKLWDPIRMQHARSNWKVGSTLGFDFRLPPSGRNPETCLESGGARRKRKKLLTDKPKLVPTQVMSLDAPEQRRRGRPKGTKNRPRDVVQAEKRARLEERRAKKAARKPRKISL
jgi:hypothetical protein